MAQGRSPGFEDKEHYGHFEIRCYARIVGSAGFDESDQDACVLMSYVWAPRGFSDDACKKFLEVYQRDL